ncbi:MAG: Ca-activated chloride channel family protein [Psychromonas sp.]|jgi:Ca-activated chloride channel family protein
MNKIKLFFSENRPFIAMELLMLAAILSVFQLPHFLLDFQLKWENAFWLQLLFLPIYILWFKNDLRKRKLSAQFDGLLLKNFLPHFDKRQRLKIYFLRISVFFLCLAFSQPLLGKKKVQTSSKDTEIVLALDVSNSMNTRDISDEISRLGIAKRAANELVNGLKGERIGVIIFAGNAYVQLPITNDYGAAKLFIGEIETKMISNQGTDFKKALIGASNMFSQSEAAKFVFMITDGENHEAIPEEELKSLKEKEVQFAIMGIGTQKGGLIPQDIDQPYLGYKTDENGKMVVSKVDPKLIRQMAKIAGGMSMWTQNEFPNLSELLTEINLIKAEKFGDLKLEVKRNFYQIPLAISLGFYLAFLFANLPKKRVLEA